jgi:hypothetical protein
MLQLHRAHWKSFGTLLALGLFVSMLCQQWGISASYGVAKVGWLDRLELESRIYEVGLSTINVSKALFVKAGFDLRNMLQ